MGELLADLGVLDRVHLDAGVRSQDEVREVGNAKHRTEDSLHPCDRLLFIIKPKCTLPILCVNRVEHCCFNTFLCDLDSADSDFVRTLRVHLRKVEGASCINMVDVMRP